MSESTGSSQSYAKVVSAFQNDVETSDETDLIIVDFDETLWLRNSTEMFLDHSGPKGIIAPVLAIIDLIKPWRLARLFGVDATSANFVARDWCRLVLVLIFAPWTYFVWRRNAASLAHEFVERDLLDLLMKQPPTRILIATFGMTIICRPLVDALLPKSRLIAMPLWSGPRMRAGGKLSALRAALDEKEIQNAVFLTDHATNDADVIKALPKSHIGRSPDALYRPACKGHYVPFRYTLVGKHAGRNHVLRVFVGEDFTALALASLPICAMPIMAGLGYLLLIVSFFIVYEVGYHENDKLGFEREEAPVFTDARLRHLDTMNATNAWIWALLIALPGIWLLTNAEVSKWRSLWSDTSLFLALLAGWVALLIFTRVLFYAFNRIDEQTRVFLYLPLQLSKGAFLATILMLPIHITGLALLIAIPVTRWLPYLVYRQSGDRKMMSGDHRFYRLLVTALLSLILPLVASGALWSTSGTVLGFGWCLFMARSQIVAVCRAAHWLKPIRDHKSLR